MNTYNLLSITFFIAILLTGCKHGDIPADTSLPVVTQKIEYIKITPKEAKNIIDKNPNVKIVDVRTEEEYLNKRIRNSILIPDYDIEKIAPLKLSDKQELILLYCRSGRRSMRAANILISMGYTHIYDFGGLNDWPYETIEGK
jgi:phage shock protein E